MTRDVLLRINHTIQIDMASTLHVVNLLSDVFQLRYTDVRVLKLSLKKHLYVVPTTEQPTTYTIYKNNTILMTYYQIHTPVLIQKLVQNINQ